MTALASSAEYAPLKPVLAQWWPVMAGLLVMYVPTFYSLLTGIWSTEAYVHGPIILALSVWLLARQWPQMLDASAGLPGSAAGWPVAVLGLLLYVVGRALGIVLAEVGSFIFMLMAVLLIARGSRALKVQWFPFFFMLFMVPLPEAVVSALTMPMKMAVSYVADQILFWFGYPVARVGVILQIGQYQLLVADACAGLQTLLTLEALGLFYLNIVRHTSAVRNIGLAMLIIPISFTANVIRVIALTLITYYLGDEAGQGFLHGFAGMVLFVTALVLIISMDSLFQMVVGKRAHAGAVASGSDQ